MTRVRFPGLNGLRFLLASGVVFEHIEQILDFHGLTNIWDENLIGGFGGACVTFFFVLSGFLITYLLIEENKLFGSIDIRKFYIRRVLRIWPLYYVVLILGIFVFPQIHAYDLRQFPNVHDAGFWAAAFLYFGFSAHVAQAFFPTIPYAAVLWSLGVEEWFYAIWPWFIKYGSRFIVVILVAIVVGITAIRMSLPGGAVLNFFHMLRFDCLAIGASFAVLLHNKESTIARSIITILRLRFSQVLIFVALAYVLLNIPFFHNYINVVISLLFGGIILNVAANPKALLKLENPVLHWLGNISFGVYCYNWMAISTAILLVKNVAPDLRGAPMHISIYALSIILTLTIAAISYEGFERKFLLLKQRFFTRVQNQSASSILGDDAPALGAAQ